MMINVLPNVYAKSVFSLRKIGRRLHEDLTLRRWVLLRSRSDAGAAQDRSSRLVPVVVASEPHGPDATLQARLPTAEVAVEIELNGAVVRVREGATAQTLRQVTAALRGVGL